MWGSTLKILAAAWAVVAVGQFNFVESCNARASLGVDTNTTCNSDRDCLRTDTYLACVKGRCTCSTVSHFEPYQQACLLYVGGSCTVPNYKGQTCVPNAYCQSKNPLATKGSCECNSGYVETVSGFCSLASSLQLSAVVVLASIFFCWYSVSS